MTVELSTPLRAQLLLLAALRVGRLRALVPITVPSISEWERVKGIDSLRSAGDVEGHEFHGNQYVFHGTDASNLESIKANGLTPNEYGNPLNFHHIEEASRYYAGKTGALLRVRKSDLPKDTRHDPTTKRSWTLTAVPRSKIEIEHAPGRWRTLGDIEGHEFHGNQWTAGGGSISEANKERLIVWQSGDATIYDDMRNPKTALGKETTKMLEAFPVHVGVTYRGLTLEDKDLAKLFNARGVTMRLHSSTSKSEDAAKSFMDIAKESYNGKPVLMELHGRTRDVSEHLQKEYFETKETVAMAGTKYAFERMVHENGYTRVTLREKR